jgi:ABC-2 type transport system ATP-binding protein
MAEAEQLCESVCIIAQGRKVLDGGLREIRRENRGNRWRVDFEEVPAEAEGVICRTAGEATVTRTESGWEIDLAPGREPHALMAALGQLEPLPLRFERVEPTLHEIFVERVGNAANPRRREVAHA